MRVDSWRFKLLAFYGLRCRHPGQWRVHGALRRWLGAGVDQEFSVERGGLKWVLNPADFVQAEFFWLGVRDRWDLYHVQRLLTPGAVVFDVGANFGHLSLSVAAALAGNGTVHAFEPFPPNLARLRRHVTLNHLDSMIVVNPVGLSDAEGVAQMISRPGNSGSATLAGTGIGEATTVQLTTLDAYCARHGVRRLDFIKVDVEGYEERLIRGGRETLRRFAPIVMIELERDRLAMAGSSVDQVVRLLRELDYELFEARRERLEPLPAYRDDAVNAFCLHRQQP